MKKTLLLVLIIIFGFIFIGCSSKNSKDSEGYSRYSDVIEGGITDKEEVIDASGGETVEPDETTIEENIQAGQLTVCAYNDNDHWDYFESLLSKDQDTTGVFYEYNKLFELQTNRIKLTLTNANNVKVELLDDNGKTEYTSYTDQNGLCYLYNRKVKDTYKVKLTYSNNGITESIEKEVKNDDIIDLSIAKQENNIIQLMFIIDTTGSMTDEIDYLKAEIKNVFETVKLDNPEATVYLSLMLYRDTSDTYLTQYYDFTTDIDSQVTNLSRAYADGGGDFEEAVDVAFDLATTKQWLDSPSTKILIHVADAPSHNEDVINWFTSVETLSSKGVRIINVASSGIDKQTEYLFRTECYLTNGYYCYLTDDSGIGNSHIEATVYEKPTVEYLNDCLIRLINGMHTGVMKDAIYYKQAN